MEIIAKLGAFSVKHMTGSRQDGSNYDFYVLSKNEKDKDGKWQSKDLFVTAADMAVISVLAQEAARKLAAQNAQTANARLADKRNAGDGAGVPF